MRGFYCGIDCLDLGGCIFNFRKLECQDSKNFIPLYKVLTVFFFEGGGGGFHTELQDADTELLDLRVLHIYFYDNDDKVPFGFKSFVQFSP